MLSKKIIPFYYNQVMCVFRSLLLLVCLTSSVLPASGQYYPGGLSNANLQLWLDANDLTTITMNASNQVSVWADKSVAASPLTLNQATLANEPLYTAAGINARPSLLFKGSSDQYFSLQSTAAATTTYFQGYSQFSHFCVYKSTNNAITTLYGREFLWKAQITAGTGALHLWASSTGSAWQTSLASGVAIPVNSNVLMSAIYNSAGTYDGYNLGSSVGSIALGGQVLGNNANNFTVGARTAGPEPLTGYMSELLIFNRNLLNSERIIMENYMSAKWGITLTANSYYTPPTATTYGTNLIGIGYATAADKVTSTAQTDGLGFNSGTSATDFLNSAGYLMAAHNGQANTILNNAAVPGLGSTSGTLGRWNRSWNIQQSNGNASGQVTLNFNFSNYNASSANATYTYGLLYNASDGSFATGANSLIATASTTVTANNVAFVVNMANLATGYYTLVWSTAGPLPLILNSFEASKAGTRSFLDWSLSSISGTPEVEIQRQVSSAGFQTIAVLTSSRQNSVTGQQDGASGGTYIDNHPSAGWNEYRLLIRGPEGSMTYSPVRTVYFALADRTGPMLYPNPVNDVMHIILANGGEASTIRIFNALGQLVQTASTTSSPTIDITLSQLHSGIYIVDILSGTARHLFKVMKN